VRRVFHGRVAPGLRPVGRAPAPRIGMVRNVNVRTPVIRKLRPRPNVIAAPVNRRVRPAIPTRIGPNTARQPAGAQPALRTHLVPRQPGVPMTAIPLVQLPRHMHRRPILHQILVEKLNQPNGIDILQHRFPKPAWVGPLPGPKSRPIPPMTGPQRYVFPRQIVHFAPGGRRLRHRPCLRLHRLRRRQITAQQPPLLRLQPNPGVHPKLP